MLNDEEKKRVLDYEIFQAEIERLRRKPDSNWWESAALMTFLTATMTALITIFGSYLVQYLSRSTDFGMEVAKTELVNKREFLKESFTIIATLLKANEDRLALAQGIYDDLPEKKRKEISDATNEADNTWRIKKEFLEFQVYLYYGRKPDLITAWKDAKSATQSYNNCIEKTFNQYQHSVAPADACKTVAFAAIQAHEKLRDKLTNDYREQVFR